MAIAYKCDRCGGFFEDSMPDRKAKHRIYKTQEHFRDTPEQLCPSCSEEINEILDNWFEKPHHHIVFEKPCCPCETGALRKPWWKR